MSGVKRFTAHGDLYGISIAFTIRSVDRSLSIRLITRLMICSKAINGIDGARDGEQNSGAGYSEVVEMRAHSFDKL